MSIIHITEEEECTSLNKKWVRNDVLYLDKLKSKATIRSTITLLYINCNDLQFWAELWFIDDV